MPCLLLDVDGVLLRDKLLMTHIKHNATRYVQQKLPHCKNPVETNLLLYLAHGHTAAGIRSFGIDVSDYNDHVYDKSLMTHLADVLESQQFVRDAEIVHKLSSNGWDVTLFSNAPHKWVEPVALAINDRVSVRCPGPDMNFATMKPDERFYQEFDSCKSYYYVDDSLKNLGAVRKLPNWRPIHFTEEFPDRWQWCPQVSTIPELAFALGNMLGS
jgi:hypothetical protein